MRFALPGSLLALALLAPVAIARDWGDPRPIPTDDDCYDFWNNADSGDDGGGGGADCDLEVTHESGADVCGCYKVQSASGVCNGWPVDNELGISCAGMDWALGGWDADRIAGRYSVSGGGYTLGGLPSAGLRISEVLVLAGELAEVTGHAPGTDVEYGAAEPADVVIGPLEFDVDDSDPEIDSLDVRGIYVVLDDLTVSGEVSVSGVLIVLGTLSAGELDLGGADPGGGDLVSGGILIADAAITQAATGSDCVVYLRNLLTDREGSWLAGGAVNLDACWGDFGEGLFASGDVTVTDSHLLTRSVSGEALAVTGSDVGRLETVDGSSLGVLDSDLDAPDRLEVTVVGDVSVQDSDLHGAGIGITAASLLVDAPSLLECRHRDDASVVLAGEPEDEDLLYPEQVWGASYGGYGGTELYDTSNSLRPAESPSGDPRDPSGPGKDGWALSWADTTYGGGGGNDITVAVTGAVVLDGTLHADGGDAPVGPLGGGGSGGSGGTIRIEGATIGGAALLTVNGGDGAMQVEGNTIGLAGGGGSGGRVAVLAGAFAGLDFEYEAMGGLGEVIDGLPEGVEEAPATWDDWRVHGGPGTTYTVEDGAPGTLTIDGNGLEAGAWGCPASGWECRGMGWLPQRLGDTDVVVQNAIVGVKDLEARSLTLHDARLVVDDPRARLPWPTPTTIFPGGLSSAQLFLPEAVFADPLSEVLTFTLTDHLTLDATSTLSLDGYGGYSRRTPAGVEDRVCWNGGSHGGVGGHGRNGIPGSDLDPEPTFDDEAAPVLPGDGGCGDYEWTGLTQEWCGMAGIGGAALHVAAGGAVTVDGAILAHGWDGKPETDEVYCISQLGNAGGAGGAIWIEADTFAGSGTLEAGGGDGAVDLSGLVCGGGGGGGRIAVDVRTSDYTGTYGVAGGAAGCDEEAQPGADGTVHLETDTDDSTPREHDPDVTDDEGCAEGCGGAAAAAPLLLLAGLTRRRRG